MECARWFHEECMARLGCTTHEGETVTEVLKGIPTMRGWPADRADDGDVKAWMTVGTGAMHEK
jgi:hypothetical protein